MERRSQGFHSQNSDEEEDEESYQSRRRGASVDDFLRGSELGRQVREPSITLCYSSKAKSSNCHFVKLYI